MSKTSVDLVNKIATHRQRLLSVVRMFPRMSVQDPYIRKLKS